MFSLSSYRWNGLGRIWEAWDFMIINQRVLLEFEYNLFLPNRPVSQ